MKKFLKWVGLLFVGLVVLGAVIEANKTPEQRAADQAALARQKAEDAMGKAEKARQQAAGMPAVTASDIARAYEANTVAADLQFKDKQFKVSGTVSDINTDIMGDPYLVLRSDGNPFMEPQFGFDQSDAAQLAKVVKGSKVTMICTGKGDVAKTPMSGDCTLL